MASWDTLAKDCNDACRLLGFTTYKGYATFIANNCQESGYFRTTEEYAKNGPYAPYIGRTFIQVTWKSNYAAMFGRRGSNPKLRANRWRAESMSACLAQFPTSGGAFRANHCAPH